MTKKLTMLVAIVVATIISCQNLEQDTYLTIEKTHLEFSAEGEVKTVTLNTNADPTVTAVPEWVSYKLENSGNEAWCVVLQCMANTSGETRTGILQVRSGKVQKYVSLSQSTCKTDIQDSTEDNTPPAEPGVASEILSMHNKKCLYSIAHSENDITVTYLENWTEGNTPTSSDFKVINVSRKDLSKFTDNKNNVVFQFKTGVTSTLYLAEVPLTVNVSKESISSNLYDLEKYTYTVDTIDFAVMCPRPELTDVEITGESSFGNDCINVNSQINNNYVGQAFIKAYPGVSYWMLSVKNEALNLTKNVKINCSYTRNALGITKQELREALVALYNSCNGKNWVKQNNWLSNKDISEWEGIRLYTVNKITVNNIDFPIRTFGIMLDENNLSGVIPEKFWSACKWCEELNLDGNDLNGSAI